MSAPQAPALELVDLETLYDLHHRQALGLAYRIVGDLGDAEEVVQEVFLSAWRSGHTYDPAKGSTHTWILSMVRNRSIDVLRARKRRPVSQLADDADPAAALDVSAEAAVALDARVAH